MYRSIMPFAVRDLERLIGDEWPLMHDTFPSMDVYQDKDSVIVEMSLPGVDKDRVNIAIENDVLTVSGSTERKSEVKREDYYRKETRSGQFSRSIVLPMPVKGDQADATYEKGILKITLPKEEAVKPKQISIKMND